MTILATEREHWQGFLQAIDPMRFGTLKAIWEFLRVSELMLLDIIKGRPENPALAGKGDPEFGHFLHCLSYPHPQLAALVAADSIAQTAWNLLAHEAKPRSALEQGYFENLKAATSMRPIVGSDGAIYGFSQYEALDFRKILALTNLITTFVHGRHSFGSTPYIGELAPEGDGTVRLGMVADWGTGSYGQNAGPAVAGMKQLAQLNCNYLFHLGDVYYAGTGGAPYYPENEVIGNFTRLWPQLAGAGRSFALNSNHEMYSGGNGYFPLTLGSSLFSHQQMTSYFALTFGKWVILGLDSAYNAPLGSLYLTGALGAKQTAWVQQYGESIGGYGDKKVLVLTHHEGQNFQGNAVTALHDEVALAIGRAPDVWYWGHLHNGIAYSNASASGKQGVKARCIGHSAVPFGVASGLQDSAGQPIPSVDYFARTPSPEGGNRVLNGFATLELSAAGGIAEAFYEVGKPNPAWRSVNGIRFV